MWVYVPDTDDAKEAWVGKITQREDAKSLWGFELIRHADEKELYRITPFDGGGTVVGLLDHQRPCTFLRPIVTKIDPGSVGIRLKGQRTRITGEFQALLSDLAVADPEARIFDGLSFDSETFGAWYAPCAFKTDFDPATRTSAVEIVPTKQTEMELSEVGRVTCILGAEVSAQGRSGVIRSAAIFRLNFSQPASLNEVLLTCHAFERLFGFLIGFRGRLPKFKVWLKKTYKVDAHELHYDGVLEISGTDWRPGEVPHPLNCVHREGQGGGTIESILATFCKGRDEFMSRIHAIEFSRFFSTNPIDRFSVVMPVLEEYLKGRYTTPDETSYIDSQKAFFEWIDSATDEKVGEFSRKHIQVKIQKAPSLTTLLTRAIDFVNAKGFAFPAEMAERIQKRRGRLFHSISGLSEADIKPLYDEVQAITGLLMLHTYSDLGIEISTIVKQYGPLSDIRQFLIQPRQVHRHEPEQNQPEQVRPTSGPTTDEPGPLENSSC